ncbi:MAG TPA: carbamate kinase [Jatrophihabitans sp.]|nr:carbamate kinase [Jatrophihabitans sp.]
MRVVVAIGGNALLERGERPDARIQLRHVHAAARALAPLTEHELIIVHGNGPQVGMLALESEADSSLSEPYPLDALVAQTQGMIGYWLSQALDNAGGRRPTRTLLTRTEVDARDPGFHRPTKFIGPGYEAGAATPLIAQRHWRMADDGGRLRRVVPSPAPVAVPEIEVIDLLLQHGQNVICAGGGGTAVVRADGGYAGVEAVVDKDLVAAHLAIELRADRLLLLTDVDGVYAEFGTPRARLIRHLSCAELAALSLPDGSMGPKAEACREFTALTQNPSAIGALTAAEAVLAGAAGTRISTTRCSGPAPAHQPS